ncbi:MAG TPA: alpha-L-fucosidase [Prolixibacteraceae bacterium]|nr:alpha-L-fucosidase [Prolixibacteraceae bacterium]
MKRRELLRSTTALAVTSCLPGWAGAIPAAGSVMEAEQKVQLSNIPRFGDGRDWFFDHRYGMFVHWGLYSIPGWHEQHQWRARVSRAEYMKLAEQWNPKKFNPEEWLDLMEEAGMKYITITTKHHDGFCLWDTRQTSFNTMNTPYKKDVIGMLADACHKRKMPLCLYYSIADWNQPNYPNQGRHHELPPQPQDSPDWNKYMSFLKEQVRELCSNYGEIHGFWWDMNVPQYKDASVNAMIRKLQPKAVINNRGFDEGDFGTPERDYDTAAAEAKGFDKPVEACQSVGMESWGYKKDEDYYTIRHLVSSIDRYLARGANYLLNVGPTGEGTIPPEASAILKKIGRWKEMTGQSFQQVSNDSEIIGIPGVLVTKRDRTLYIHMNKALVGTGLKLKPINVLPVKATLLNTGKEIDCVVNLCPSDHGTQEPFLRLRNLPCDEMADTVLVAKLEFEQSLDQIVLKKKSDTNIELVK